MKNLLKVTTVLAAASLLLSGCNCFKKMAKDPSAIKVTATPEVLAYNNGKIAADIKAEIPADYFNKKATLKVTPAIAFEGGLVTGETLLLQGEKVLSNGLVVKKAESLSLNRHVEFAYQKGMERCELKLLVEVKCKKGEFTLINANNGALPTKEEAAILAKGGDAAKAVKKEFGLTVAKGLNMLQKDLDRKSVV